MIIVMNVNIEQLGRSMKFEKNLSGLKTFQGYIYLLLFGDVRKYYLMRPKN